jgi:hypothetical protein
VRRDRRSDDLSSDGRGRIHCRLSKDRTVPRIGLTCYGELVGSLRFVKPDTGSEKESIAPDMHRGILYEVSLISPKSAAFLQFRLYRPEYPRPAKAIE